SSRRRHTRFSRDWSSDVCSSDLQVMATGYLAGGLLMRLAWSGGRRWRLALGAGLALAAGNLAGHPQTSMFLHYALGLGMLAVTRSEERRVGRECGSRGAALSGYM